MAAWHDPKTLSARAVEKFQSLHKGLGVQDPKLRQRLGPELRALWQIQDDDGLPDVRRKVIAVLREVVAEVGGGENLETVVSYRYNYALHHEVSKLALGGRESRLNTLKGAGFSPRNVLRIIEPFQDEMRRRLSRPLPRAVTAAAPEGPAQVAGTQVPTVPFVAGPFVAGPTTATAETGVCAQIGRGPSPPTFGRIGNGGRAPHTRLARSVRQMNTPAITLVDEALRNFLSDKVYEPRLGSGRATVNTEIGDWLCVFSDVDRLVVYRDAVGADWSHPPLAKTGAEIVLEIVHSGQRLGILCDPSPRLGGSSQDTLMLPPDEVWRLGGPTTG